MSDDKEYAILADGNDIVKRLRDHYPRIYWAVDPATVIVLAVTNKPRPFSMKKLATIHLITPAMRTLIKALGHKDVRYYIEVYLSDWNTWGVSRQQWICSHELLHVPQEGAKGLIQHDLIEFSMIVDYLGIATYSSENLPNMLDGDPLPLNEALAVKLHRTEPEENEDEEQEFA